MSRSRSNCSVTRALPSDDPEVISVTPAMRPSARSSGVATVAAMISGLAPGSCAGTEMVGKSTCGSGDTGSRRKAAAPASVMPAVSSVVATGRRIDGFGQVHGRSALDGFGARTAPPSSLLPLTRRARRSNHR